MSKYTTEVRFICEQAAGLFESKGFNDVDTIIQTAAPHIFNFNFPIYDELYRLPLEIKILRHYYTREICAETSGLWKLFLNDRLNLIMPYYNKLYESALLTFNPFHDVDLTREHEIEGENVENGTSSNTRTDNLSAHTLDTNESTDQATTDDTGTITDAGTHSNSNTVVDKYSDTPQGGLTGLLNDNYLTSAKSVSDTESGTNGNTRTLATEREFTGQKNDEREITTTNTGTQQNSGTTRNTITTTEDYLEHLYGKTGGTSYSKLLKEYRETFLNIDKMVVGELKDLFFGLW